MFLEEIYKKTGYPKRDVLYHYTTNSGILGIIGSWELWATKIRYTNDSREFLHAIDMAKGALDKLRSRDSTVPQIVFDDMRGAIDGIQNVHVCIVSFTENEDLLSQWRGYSNQGSGYAIGFEINSLVRVANSQGFLLAKCIYDTKVQQQIVEEFVAKEVELMKKDRLNSFKISHELCQIAALMKDEGFKEEDEWRLFSGPMKCSDKNFQFRAGANTLIPYFSINLKNDTERVKVKDIICGPNPNLELAKASIYALVVKQEIYDLPIRESSIPYRKW